MVSEIEREHHPIQENRTRYVVIDSIMILMKDNTQEKGIPKTISLLSVYTTTNISHLT